VGKRRQKKPYCKGVQYPKLYEKLKRKKRATCAWGCSAASNRGDQERGKKNRRTKEKKYRTHNSHNLSQSERGGTVGSSKKRPSARGRSQGGGVGKRNRKKQSNELKVSRSSTKGGVHEGETRPAINKHPNVMERQTLVNKNVPAASSYARKISIVLQRRRHRRNRQPPKKGVQDNGWNPPA